MTGPAPQPGDTQAPAGGGPWDPPGPEGTWWHGQEPPADATGTPPEAAPAVKPAPDPVPAAARPTEEIPAPSRPSDDEASAFWLPSEDVPRDGTAWPAQQMRAGRPGPAFRAGVDVAARRSAPKPPRRPAVALPAMVLFALLAAFFGWVSAEPLWLAVGHGTTGTATVTACKGSGVAQRCVGAFKAADGGFTATRVTLLGVTAPDRKAGSAVAARMVGGDSRQAYAGTDDLALHLRWSLGLLLVLVCGAAIAWASGATRLADRRARRRAVLGSLAGPLLIALLLLAAAW